MNAPRLPPMTPEQFELKRRADIEANRSRVRITLAARFLTAGLAAAGERDDVWTEAELRAHAVGALKVADVLLEEAAKPSDKADPGAA